MWRALILACLLICADRAFAADAGPLRARSGPAPVGADGPALDPAGAGAGPEPADRGHRGAAVAAGGAAAAAHRADRGGGVRPAAGHGPPRPARGRSRRAARACPASTAASPAAQPTEEAAAARPPPRTAQPSTIAPDDAARQGHVLGTIPEDALRGQPRSGPRPCRRRARRRPASRRAWCRKVRTPPTRARWISFRPGTGRPPSSRSPPS